ncbi:MAG: U32 family peptidase [Phycisphaerales bacterium]|nr:U32 family peptidase [Phycisphaerales bacterium]
MSSTRPELLAPAGDWDALKAGVLNGADAIYFGLDQFNARHRATNFTLQELPEVVAYLHAHNVKGYLTFNTLIFSDELASAETYLQQIAQSGVDAVIVQDLGIAALLHRLCPDLDIHASTQMTLTDPRGIAFARTLGIKRVILPRELSLQEITHLTTTGPHPAELEVFIHGALCISYSGQCLASKSLCDRSANRGQCAQPCRLPYTLILQSRDRKGATALSHGRSLTVAALNAKYDKSYLLSPSDLATHDLIADLTAAGITAFKIEGRLKSAHYVAAVCQTYRAAIDAAVARCKFQISDSQRLALEQTFSRGFTHGFLDGTNHQHLITPRFPKSRGTHIGTVINKTKHAITIKIENQKSKIENPHPPLKPGDGIVFDEGHPDQDEQGGRLYGVTFPPSPGNTAELQFHPGDLNLAAINIGAIVWKTDDPAVKKRLEHSFARETVTHRIPINFTVKAAVGEYLQLTARAEGRQATAHWPEKKLEKATKFPATIDTLRQQLARLGETLFELNQVTLEGQNAMVPKSALNALRRQVTSDLSRRRNRTVQVHENILNKMRRELPTRSDSTSRRDESTTLYILARSHDQLEALLERATQSQIENQKSKIGMVYLDFKSPQNYPAAVQRCRNAGLPVALATLRILKPGEEEGGGLTQLLNTNPDALLIRNLAALSFYQEKAPHLPLIGDHSLNIANELTANLLTRAGLTRLTPSYDLNWPQLSAMLHRFDPARFEVVIHQYMPMFHMDHCVFAHTLSNGTNFQTCGRPCEKHRAELQDRLGEKHPLLADAACRNTLFNATAQSDAHHLPEMQSLGLRHFRIEFLREDLNESRRLIDRYSRLLAIGHQIAL